jgi:hypothetical protein
MSNEYYLKKFINLVKLFNWNVFKRKLVDFGGYEKFCRLW